MRLHCARAGAPLLADQLYNHKHTHAQPPTTDPAAAADDDDDGDPLEHD